MIEMQNLIKDPVTSEELERFIQDISANDGSDDSSFGKELEFYERNNFSPIVANLLYWSFPYYISRPGSPFAMRSPDGLYYEATWIEGSYDRDESYHPDGRDRIFCYSVALQLRNYLRDKFNRLPLPSDEINCFRFGGYAWPNADKAMIEKYPFYEVSDEEVRLASSYACKAYPGFVDYHRGLIQLAPAQGYPSSDVCGRSIIRAYINDSLHAVVPGIGEYGYYHVGDRFDKAIISHDK